MIICHRYIGIDREGNEQVYREFTSDQPEAERAWKDSDPLFRSFFAVMMKRAMQNPVARDAVIKLNIAAAMREGNEETAVKLFKALSWQAQQDLYDKYMDDNSRDEGAAEVGSQHEDPQADANESSK